MINYMVILVISHITELNLYLVIFHDKRSNHLEVSEYSY